MDSDASRYSQTVCEASHSVWRIKVSSRLALWRQSMSGGAGFALAGTGGTRQKARPHFCPTRTRSCRFLHKGMRDLVGFQQQPRQVARRNARPRPAFRPALSCRAGRQAASLSRAGFRITAAKNPSVLCSAGVTFKNRPAPAISTMSLAGLQRKFRRAPARKRLRSAFRFPQAAGSRYVP